LVKQLSGYGKDLEYIEGDNYQCIVIIVTPDNIKANITFIVLKTKEVTSK